MITHVSYGASGFKISKQLGIEREEGDKIVNDFYRAFPDLTKYFKDWHQFVKATGYVLVDTVVYRRSYFPFYEEYIQLKETLDNYSLEKGTKDHKKLLSRYMKLRGAMERMAQNFRIQGTNASMTKMSMIMLYDWIKSKEWFDKVKIVLSLHDEIVIEAKDEVAEEVESKLVEFMLKSGTYFCSKVPMKVEGGIAKVWDH